MKKKHYVNNRDFHQALLNYHKECAEAVKKGEPLPVIPDYIGVCINMICNKLSLKVNFVRYSFLDEMIGEAVMHCIAAVSKFNPKFNNPFAYFTSIAWNAFLRKIEEETSQNYTKHKNMEGLFILSDEFYSEMDDIGTDGRVANQSIQSDGLQKHYQVIQNFEDKQARKKEKNRQASLRKRKTITKSAKLVRKRK